MSSILGLRLKSEFMRGVLVLASGTVFTNLVTILATPLLSRLYGPDDFGLWALYTSILSVATVVACGRYELAIMLPEKTDDALAVLILAVMVNVGVSLLALAFVALFHEPILAWLGRPDLGPWLWIMPASLLFSGLYQATSYWLTRNKAFKAISVAQVNQSLATVGIQLGLGSFFLSSAAGLIAGHFVGVMVAAKSLIWQVWRSRPSLMSPANCIHLVKTQASIHRDFPLYNSWAALLNAISLQLPIFLLGSYFPAAIVGYFAVANRFLALPMRLIGGSVAQVFYQQAAEAKHTGNLRDLILSVSKKLALIVIPPMLIFALIAPGLFELLLGAQWRSVGIVTQALVPFVTMQFIVSPISNTGGILGLQKQSLIWTIGKTVGSAAALALGSIHNNYVSAISFYAGFNLIAYLAIFLMYLHYAGVSDRAIR